jgi:hypothetical protein
MRRRRSSWRTAATPSTPRSTRRSRRCRGPRGASPRRARTPLPPWTRPSRRRARAPSRCSTATTRFGPRHLERLVAAAARERRAWLSAAWRPPARRAAEHAARCASETEQADTVGAAFVAAHYPAVVATNLIVDRALALRAGACARRGPLWAWSLALDLVALAEPAYAPDAAYRVPAGDEEIGAPADEAAIVALFRGYYARALASPPLPNPLAPSPRSLGDAFFRHPLQSGHVLLFDPGEIDALAERVIAWARAPVARRPGVTFAGFAFGEFGLGENLRAIARACEAAKLPFDVRDVGVDCRRGRPRARWPRMSRRATSAPRRSCA